MLLVIWLGIGSSPSARAQEGWTETPTRRLQRCTETPVPTETSTPAAADYYSVEPLSLSDGIVVEEMIIHGPPVPPPGYEIQRQSVSVPDILNAAGTNILTVPAYPWVFGCSAVSGAMIAGYYDRNGYPNMYTGPTDGGVMPLVNNSSWGSWADATPVFTYYNNPLVASKLGLDGRVIRGSIDDYWVQYGSSAPDPFIGHWTEHTWGDAIGDYMHTSQSSYNGSSTWGLADAYTRFYDVYPASGAKLTCDTIASYLPYGYPPDGTLGRAQFYQAKGYAVTDCYNQYTDNQYSGGFSFAQYKAEIDAGRPVMIARQHVGAARQQLRVGKERLAQLAARLNLVAVRLADLGPVVGFRRVVDQSHQVDVVALADDRVGDRVHEAVEIHQALEITAMVRCPSSTRHGRARPGHLQRHSAATDGRVKPGHDGRL